MSQNSHWLFVCELFENGLLEQGSFENELLKNELFVTRFYVNSFTSLFCVVHRIRFFCVIDGEI
ncbi:unknow [Vibrio campbellii]|nr:unknow [Vibrio campbellii]